MRDSKIRPDSGKREPQPRRVRRLPCRSRPPRRRNGASPLATVPAWSRNADGPCGLPVDPGQQRRHPGKTAIVIRPPLVCSIRQGKRLRAHFPACRERELATRANAPLAAAPEVPMREPTPQALTYERQRNRGRVSGPCLHVHCLISSWLARPRRAP